MKEMSELFEQIRKAEKKIRIFFCHTAFQMKETNMRKIDFFENGI